MREIKFRAWHRVSKQMFSWDSFTINGRNNCIIHFTEGLFTTKRIDDNSVDLMQYIGLKNIYEGDIVAIKYWHNNPPSKRPKKSFIVVNLPVIYERGAFGVDDESIRMTEYGTTYGNWWEHCEIIGNIYEHPHLLNSEPKDKRSVATDVDSSNGDDKQK